MDTTRSAAAPQVPGYELLERVGAGASSVVWRARRRADGALVAVKVVRVWGDGDTALREFELLRRVGVEGVVPVHETFSLPDDPGAVAVVLDFLEGGSLVSVLAARGHLSAGEAVTVLAPVARALAGLHAAGVVHADVSPGNVLLARSGRPVLADLGVSRLTGEVPGETFGTEGFTAPEVEAGGQPSPASDVYAVGALAWACVTGGPPGPLGARRPLAELAPGLPADWSDVVRDCLAPLAADRPSAAEAALRFFDAVPCEPLRLVAGEDEVSLLTRRIRSAPPPEEPEAVQGWRARSADRWRQRLEAVGAALRCGVSAGPSRRAVVAVGVCAAVGAAATVWGTGWPGPAGATPAGPVVPSTAPAASPPGSAAKAGEVAAASTTGAAAKAGGVAGAVAAVRQDPQAPRRHPERLMQALADDRARVLSAGSARRLGEVDLPESPAWAADERLLRQLHDRGERYEALSFVVRSARTTSASGAQAALRVRVDTGAYRVVGPGGTQVDRPPEPGRELVVRLRWSQERWVVEEVQGADG